MSDKDPIEYSPEELAEIQRIVSILPGSSNAADEGGVMSLAGAAAPPPAKDPAMEEGYRSFSELLEDTDDADNTFSANDAIDELPGDAIMDISDDIAELSDEDLTFAPQEDAAEDFADIPSFDTSAEQPATETFADLPDFDSDGGGFSISDGSDLPDIPDLDGFDEGPADETFSRGRSTADSGSTLGQLDALLADEPESVDEQDISSDMFVDAGEPAGAAEAAESPDDIPLSDDFAGDEFDELPAMALDGGADESLPDMSELDLGSADIPEADELDVPDVDLGGLGGLDFSEEPSVEPVDDFGGGLNELDGFGSMPESPSGAAGDDAATGADVLMIWILAILMCRNLLLKCRASISSLWGMRRIFSGRTTTAGYSRVHGPASATAPSSGAESESGSVDLSDEELRRLKKALALYPAGLMYAVRDAVLKDMLAPADTRQLVDMILDNRPVDNIRRFLRKSSIVKLIRMRLPGGSGGLWFPGPNIHLRGVSGNRHFSNGHVSLHWVRLRFLRSAHYHIFTYTGPGWRSV
jgi:hypothetical protein